MTSREPDWDDEERRALEGVRDELALMRERHRHDLPLDLMRASAAGALPDDVDRDVRARFGAGAWGPTLVEGADAAQPALDARREDRILSRVRAEARVRRLPLWPRGWVWATAAVATAVLIAIAVFETPRTTRPESTVARTAAPSREAPAVYHLPLDKPEVRFTASALVFRGHATQEKFVDVVAPAVAAYRAGDYPRAAREFAALRERYPNSIEVFFYLGISRLFTGDLPGAIDALTRAQQFDDRTFGPEASWYLAVAYDRAGRRPDARAELAELCAGRTAMAARACDAARRLE